MTATATETRTEPVEESTPLFTIWAEGFAATGEAETAWQLNESPIGAASFDEAVRLYSEASESRYLFKRHRNGTWTYWGCRLFDNESDARGAFG
ncbi:hypothetical protein Achl_4466 (plasmid) [Pseudarthrobacter chlorophenolicus A6]|uniref:Uncharacterized protein n=1 Tax=Pseudarthrobacter chlorophenolicus (strain ATCC 700700 / DSM 12829 / CIP 107037 / JCM 12360 / KCTC 9906 / NCIMB 13794 / A6) TaxID=452863 RepID=B8HJ20_PSECP|nr:hypothetical protein [Pseudarthrobacter chlorophenolicus]ACL42417.1 hypothetical protein Achl_4466 [Pseudarthrobacter chlorophenolicus A6]SDQ17842.1 hypothetical protein SAMN04489738_0523 [Pseudarthrobacter chlorophenolicus]